MTVYDPVTGVLSSVQTKTIRKVSILVCMGVFFIYLFFLSDSQGEVRIQEIEGLICLKWKECSTIYSVPPYFSVYGIIFSIFHSIILFVEDREPLKKVRYVLIQNWIVYRHTGWFWSFWVFNVSFCTTFLFCTLNHAVHLNRDSPGFSRIPADKSQC